MGESSVLCTTLRGTAAHQSLRRRRQRAPSVVLARVRRSTPSVEGHSRRRALGRALGKEREVNSQQSTLSQPSCSLQPAAGSPCPGQRCPRRAVCMRCHTVRSLRRGMVSRRHTAPAYFVEGPGFPDLGARTKTKWRQWRYYSYWGKAQPPRNPGGRAESGQDARMWHRWIALFICFVVVRIHRGYFVRTYIVRRYSNLGRSFLGRGRA